VEPRAAARAHPAARTGTLAATLAVVAASLLLTTPGGTLTAVPAEVPRWALLAGTALLFGLAEACLLHVEVRRDAYTITLAGVPLVLALLVQTPAEVVLARVAGSAAAFLLQRSPVAKVAYNLAAYAAEAALDAALTRVLLAGVDVLSVRGALTTYTVVAVVDQLTTWLITQVIGWHQGPLTRRQAAQVQLSAVLCTVLATTGALVAVLLLRQGALGRLVLATALLAAAAVYRGFQVLHRRHHALEQMQGFIGLSSEPSPLPDVAGRMLGQVRDLMRAGSAQLLLIDGDSTVTLCAGEDGVVHEGGGAEPGWALEDALVTGVRAHQQSVVLPAGTRRSAERVWLAGRGARDAIVVPLPRGSGEGALMVFDRLGTTGSFTGEDRSLLQTLAGHLSVAVRSNTLLDRLRHDATHDALTGLANRSLLEETLGSEATLSSGCTVLLLDLDRFKEVNDTLGHHVGDALLRAVATTISAALPVGSSVARLGGDEFAAVIPHRVLPQRVLPQRVLPPGIADRVADPGNDTVGAPPDALAIELARRIAAPVHLPEAVLSTRASIGVARSAAGAATTDLLRHADTAMYAAKDSGTAVVVYTAALDRGRAERLELLADLHVALDRRQLVVVYQPKLDLATDAVTGVEALVRWRHPRRGMIHPDVFVPLAEAHDLIGPLTEQVLREALRQCAVWRSAGLDLTVAVNLSARVVNDDALPGLIASALHTAGVPTSSLVLEITESAVMDDPDHAVAILESIAALGVVLSLDDFGTGYSSLAYLRRLPVREIKIDRSFVTGLATDPDRGGVLVRAIINLATSLGHRVVAEGAEDGATVDLLRELGCHLVQGYTVSPPQAPELVSTFVRARLAAAEPPPPPAIAVPALTAVI